MFKLQKIAAGAVGVSIILGLAAVAIPAGAQTGGTFSANLTVGSRGADVSALQSILIAGGHLTAVTTPTGYFGAATKAALAKWQASVGISPAAGYFGPISRAYLNTHATGGVSTVPGCTAGAMFSSTTGAPCTTTGGTLPAGCVVGAMYSSTTGAPCTTTSTGGSSTVWSPDGTDGSATVSYVSFAPASQTLKKGDTNKPVISVKLQAVNGKVAVTRFDVHFSERPWLDFGSVSLVDSTGKVIATKTLSSASDVTEVTVGTDYLVRFDNISYVVTPGSDAILAVNVNVLAASDKITGQTVKVSVPAGAIRTINGKGYTDSVGLTSGQGSDLSSNGNAVTLSSTGSTAALYTRISPNTPAQRIVVTNATNNTTNVVLGVFGLKAQNQSATVNSLSFNVNNSTGAATTTLLSNLRLQVGGQTFGANALTAGNTTFTNLNIALPVDQWTDVTLLADINANQANISASSTLVAASISGVDSNYNALSLSTASNVTSNDAQFLLNGLSVTNTSATVGSAVTQNNFTVGYNVTYKFTLTNTGNSDLFVARNPGSMLATTSSSSTGGSTASSTITSVTVSPDTFAADASSTLAYVIPAGSSRDFTFTGRLSPVAGGGAQNADLRITGIYFNTYAALVGATSTASTNSITFGLGSLRANAGF